MQTISAAASSALRIGKSLFGPKKKLTNDEINQQHLDDLRTRLLVVINRVKPRDLKKNIYGVIGGRREYKKPTRAEMRKYQDKQMKVA